MDVQKLNSHSFSFSLDLHAFCCEVNDIFVTLYFKLLFALHRLNLNRYTFQNSDSVRMKKPEDIAYVALRKKEAHFEIYKSTLIIPLS